jgi:hypothetical protein
VSYYFPEHNEKSLPAGDIVSLSLLGVGKFFALRCALPLLLRSVGGVAALLHQKRMLPALQHDIP